MNRVVAARGVPGSTDRGAAAVILVLLTPVLFALAGLVLDGGAAITARQRAADLAEQAARAGVNALDVSALRASGADVLNPARAQLAACGYLALAAPGAGCTVSISADQIRVGVRMISPTVLLGLIGINSFHVSGWASAAAVRGVTSGEAS